MGVTRRGVTQHLLQINLPRCRIQQVGAAHHIGDALCRVVHHGCQLIGVVAVGPFHHEIADLAFQTVHNLALDDVLEFDAGVVGDHAIGTRGAAGEQAFAAGAGVNRAVQPADG